MLLHGIVKDEDDFRFCQDPSSGGVSHILHSGVTGAFFVGAQFLDHLDLIIPTEYFGTVHIA